MTNKTQTAIVLSAIVLALAGCSESSPTLVPPSTSQPALPAPEPVTFRADVVLSGVVFEEATNGREPIQGVWVYCEPCTLDTHAGTYTDANGFYTFTGVWTDGLFPTRIHVQKDGYADPRGLPTPTFPNPSGPGWRQVLIDGDTRFDIELLRR